MKRQKNVMKMKKGYYKMATKSKISNELRIKEKWELKTETKPSEKLKQPLK